jgi:ankyrin repeat protein
MGASPNLKNKYGQTPLHTAVIYCGNSEILEEVMLYLGMYNGNINGKDCAGNTPLFYAVEKEPLLLETFLQFHPEISEINHYSWSPLCKAVFLNLKEQADILLKNGANLQNSCGRISVKELLDIKLTGKIPKNLKHLLFQPKAGYKNFKYIQADFKVNVDKALEFSLTTDNLKEFRLIVEGNLAHFNKLNLAENCCKFCSCKILNYLFSSGNNLNRSLKDGETLLHICAKNGCKNCLGIFKKYNFDSNAKDRRGFTPYCTAIENNQIETAKELLKFGANSKMSCVKVAEKLKELNEFLGF